MRAEDPIGEERPYPMSTKYKVTDPPPVSLSKKQALSRKNYSLRDLERTNWPEILYENDAIESVHMDE